MNQFLQNLFIIFFLFFIIGRITYSIVKLDIKHAIKENSAELKELIRSVIKENEIKSSWKTNK